MSPQSRRNTEAQEGAQEAQEAAQGEPEANGNADRYADAAQPYIALLFEEAFELNERYEELLKLRTSNRDSLRQNRRFMTDEQVALLDELYKERHAVRRTPEERAAALEARAQEVREQAARKAQKEAEEAAAAAAAEKES